MISQNLSYLRKIHRYSQELLAEKIGVSRQAIAKWEAGDTVPDLENCIALAELYGVTVDDLIRYEPDVQGVPIAPKGKHVFGTVTVGERGQIVIPKKAREIFRIRPGDSLMVLGDEGQGLALVRADVFLSSLQELLKQGGEQT